MTVMLSFRVSDEFNERLRNRATQLGISYSDILRQGATQRVDELDAQAAPEERSLDAARSLLDEL